MNMNDDENYIIQLQNRITDLESQVEKLEDTNSDLECTVKDLERDITEKNKQLVAFQNENKEFDGKLSELNEKFESYISNTYDSMDKLIEEIIEHYIQLRENEFLTEFNPNDEEIDCIDYTSENHEKILQFYTGITEYLLQDVSDLCVHSLNYDIDSDIPFKNSSCIMGYIESIQERIFKSMKYLFKTVNSNTFYFDTKLETIFILNKEILRGNYFGNTVDDIHKEYKKVASSYLIEMLNDTDHYTFKEEYDRLHPYYKNFLINTLHYIFTTNKKESSPINFLIMSLIHQGGKSDEKPYYIQKTRNNSNYEKAKENFLNIIYMILDYCYYRYSDKMFELPYKPLKIRLQNLYEKEIKDDYMKKIISSMVSLLITKTRHTNIPTIVEQLLYLKEETVVEFSINDYDYIFELYQSIVYSNQNSNFIGEIPIEKFKSLSLLFQCFTEYDNDERFMNIRKIVNKEKLL